MKSQKKNKLRIRSIYRISIGSRIRGSHSKNKNNQPVASAADIGKVKPKINFEIE